MPGHRLALGTVQFGLPYGVANRTGQIGHEEAAAILDYAWTVGVDTLDTAISYGTSEQRLGEIGIDRWHVISKLPGRPERLGDVSDWVRTAVHASLRRLRIGKLKALLFHRPEDLLEPGGDTLYDAALEVKDEGFIENVGVSIYDPQEMAFLWPRFAIDVVQVPFNVFDRRLLNSGWLERLHKAGVAVHVRSIFLQGLLLMRPDKRPRYFDRWLPLLDKWDRWLRDNELNALLACLAFAVSYSEIQRVVVGVDGLTQFKEIITNLKPIKEIPFPDFASNEIDLINPTRWTLL